MVVMFKFHVLKEHKSGNGTAYETPTRVRLGCK